MKLAIPLNDFSTFDRLLFNAEEMALPEKARWRKFYNGMFTVSVPFLPKIPETVVEHQFCHYVYWMTIWACNLIHKPDGVSFVFGESSTHIGLCNLCFACQYTISKENRECPIERFTCGFERGCTDKDSPYSKWAVTENHEEREKLAYEIAHLKWTDRKD